MPPTVSWSGHTSGVTDGQFGQHPLSTLAVTTGKEKIIALHSLEGEPVQVINFGKMPISKLADNLHFIRPTMCHDRHGGKLCGIRYSNRISEDLFHATGEMSVFQIPDP